jgi:hypothetical protein
MTTRSRLLPVLVLCAAAVWQAGQPARGAETGTITGTVDKADQVTAVTAIDRDNDNKKYPGKVDAKTGRFTIDGLPLDAVYDVILDYGGARLEGVNLKVPHSDYEKEQPLSKDDVEEIKKVARLLNQFEDTVEVMTVTGNIQHSAVLLNKRRTKAFYESKPGEIIWRLELWHFEKPDETWIKDQEELGIVFYRERIQKTDYDKKALTLDAALGGLKLTAKQTAIDLGQVQVPAKEAGIRLRPIKTEH